MKIVLAMGCFDLLHVGHLRHLEEAQLMGGMLVVGVTRDNCVNKPGRPIIPEEERLEMVKGLACVADAMLCRNSIEALWLTRPDIFCKGNDYFIRGLLPEEIEYCRKNGIEIRFTQANKQTTSSIIERIKCAS